MDDTPESQREETAIAAADSLYGQLQRGRGSGFLQALQEDATTIQPLLLDCVFHDPRWDRQLESRDRYYAGLIQQVGLPLEPIATQLQSFVADEDHDAEAYLFSIVAELARRRVAGAEHIVRDYLTYGCEWEDALANLAEVSDTALDIDAVSQLIEQRFPDDETLATNLTFYMWITSSSSAIWDSLRKVNERVERIVSEQEKAQALRQHAKEDTNARLAALSASELLALDINSDTARDIARMLMKCVTASDRDRVIHLAQQGDRWQRYVAFRALEPIADVSMLPMLLAFFESNDAISGSLYGAAIRAIIALPPDATRSLAHAWFTATERVHRHVGVSLIEEHATADDMAGVRAWLVSSFAQDQDRSSTECYMQGGMLEALARFPDSQSYEVAEMAFIKANYARNRTRAAATMIACDASRFRESLAFECLWDSEDEVVALGCEMVDIGVADALAKVQTLASDPYEDEYVRAAATKRLTSS